MTDLDLLHASFQQRFIMEVYEHHKVQKYLIYCSGFPFKEDVASWQLNTTKMLDFLYSSE